MGSVEDQYRLLYGSPRPPVARESLHAGAVSAELDGADLRYVRFGGLEVLRRLYLAVRDHNWDTVPMDDVEVRHQHHADQVVVELSGVHRADPVAFAWTGSVVLETSALTARFEGRCESRFRYNRIGWNLLHPPPITAGRPYRAQTERGWINGVLPELIGPQLMAGGQLQGLFDPMQRLEIDADQNLTLSFEFEGDLFEMEDQRNWTDASFKTYSSPLSGPWPYQAEPGQEIRQAVSIRFGQRVEERPASRGRTMRPRQAGSDSVRVELGGAVAELPEVGLGMAPGALHTSASELLRALGPNHLRVDVASDDQAVPALHRGLEQAGELGCRLEIALCVPASGRFDPGDLVDGPPAERVCRVLVVPERGGTTDARHVTSARRLLEARFPAAAFLGGTNAYFVDLNRDRPSLEGADGVVYPLCPQVHAFDDTSVMETITVQADTVTTSRAIAPQGAAIVVSPITLLPRFNPNATDGDDEQRPAPDPRQASFFAAAWTAGTVASLGATGITAATFFETVGPRGVLDHATGSGGRPSIFPVFHVLADLSELRTSQVVSTTVSEPLRVSCLAMRNQQGLSLLVANLVAERSVVTLPPIRDGAARIRRLHTGHAADALGAEAIDWRTAGWDSLRASDHLELEAFEVARVELPA